MSGGSVWNPENIRDVSESVGIANLGADVVDHLTRDVEFRIAQVLEEALKFMRHAKRTTLFTQDVSQALRTLGVEPVYGYESTRPLRFGEASIGPGQPLYYVEDEEIDFEKLINAPLPKVPRDMTFTAHWLAVEGVQPTIPQNPAPADSSRNTDLMPKTNPHLAAAAGADNLSVKPLVKHILSKELQLFFDHVCAAVLDESNEEYRQAALTSLRSDPGLHQLVPYFIHFVAEKVTHSLKSLFVLTQMLRLVASLLENPHLHMAPYVASMVPPVLTCLIGKRLGPSAVSGSGLPQHYELREYASSLLQTISRKKFADSTPTLKPRLARTLLKTLLSPTAQPIGTYYGAVRGLCGIAGAEGVRALLLPNLKALDETLREALAGADGASEEQRRSKKAEVDHVVSAVISGLLLVELDSPRSADEMDVDAGDSKSALTERLGELFADGVYASQKPGLIATVLAQDAAL